MTANPQLWKSAVHEAGHAVVAAVERLGVIDAVLYPEEPEGVAGETVIHIRWRVLKRNREYRWLRCVLAGVAAEKMLASQLPPATDEEAAVAISRDVMEAERILRQVLGLHDDFMNRPEERKRCDRSLKRQMRRVFLILHNHHNALLRVARALMEPPHRVGGRQLRALVHEVADAPTGPGLRDR